MKSLSDINWHHLIDTRRYLIMSVVCGLIAVAIVFFAMMPQIQESMTLFSQQQTETGKLKVLTKKAADLEAMDGSPLMDQIQTVNQVLPSKKPLLELMGSLSTAARENQVSVTHMELAPGKIATEGAEPKNPTKAKSKSSKKTEATTKKTNTETLDIDLTLLGGLANLNAFFENMENRAPLSTISEISLTKKTTDLGPIDEDDMFEAEITISTYYFTQSVSSAVESALPSVTQQQQAMIDELNSFVLTRDETQLNIQGGGLNDLFGISQPELEIAQ